MAELNANDTKTAVQIFGMGDDLHDYFDQFRSIEKTISQIRNSIITVTDPVWPIPSYSINIPGDIDIFSELQDEVYNGIKNKQMTYFIRKFKQVFYQKVINLRIEAVLPKLEYYIDVDNSHMIRLASTWDQGNAMLYFSFEDDEKDSSFGLIWNDKAKKNYESRTGNVLLNDEDEIIREVCDFILRVFV